MQGLVATFLVLAALSSGCGQPGDEVSAARQRCVELRDHLIDLRLKGVTGVDVAKHRQLMERALGEHFLAKCSDQSDEEVRCALTAPDFAAVAACSTSSAGR